MKHLYIIIFAVCLCGCSSQYSSLVDKYISEMTQTIAVDVSKDNFCEIIPLVKDYKFIPLEISDKCIIGEINKILVRDGRFYILDRRQQKMIYVFDANGKYLLSIGRQGRGPGEYTEPTDFIVTNDTITVYDQYTHKLNYYSLNGEYISSQTMPYKIYEIEEAGNNEMFVVTGDNSNIKEIKDYVVLHLSHDNNILNKYCHNKYSMNYSNEYDLYTFNGDIVYAKALQPGVFAIDDNGFYLKYKFETKPASLPSDFEAICKGDFAEFKDKYANTYAHFNGQYWETSGYVGFGINYSNKPYLVVYDKKSKEGYAGMVGIRFGLQSDDINGVLASAINNSPTFVNGNGVVGSISADRLPRSIRDTLWGNEYNSEFCNPVLVHIEFKD